MDNKEILFQKVGQMIGDSIVKVRMKRLDKFEKGLKKLQTKALNEKVAIFVGFKIPINKYNNKPFAHGKNCANLWESPSGEIVRELPDLVNDLNTQAKWLMPKLQNKGFTITLTAFEHQGYSSEITDTTGGDTFIIVENESLSESFALAVEKLIDSMDINHDD